MDKIQVQTPKGRCEKLQSVDPARRGRSNVSLIYLLQRPRVSPNSVRGALVKLSTKKNRFPHTFSKAPCSGMQLFRTSRGRVQPPLRPHYDLWPPRFRTFCELVEVEENKLTTFSTWTIMLGCNESNIIFQQHLCKHGQAMVARAWNDKLRAPLPAGPGFELQSMQYSVPEVDESTIYSYPPCCW